MTFLDLTSKAKATKGKINEITSNQFLHSKGNQQMKGQLIEGEEMFANHVSDQELISCVCIFVYSFSFTTEITNNPIKKWTEHLNRCFFQRRYKMTNRYLRRCSTSLIIRELQIKTTVRCHLTVTSHLLQWLSIGRQKLTSVGQEVEKWELLCTAGGELSQPLWKI